ncbi:MAG TPA: hypothetical protein VFQ83_06815 [Candidatus Udaeobacter sp.]|jgi:hypothetical protein|nr:hypothetical protein [Candidatus Udaeobacter sp.]
MNKTLFFGICFPSVYPAHENILRFTTALFKFGKFFQIAFEYPIGLNTVLQTAQISVQLGRSLFGQRIDDPVLISFRDHQASVTQVSKMLGNLDLLLTENVLKVTDAKWRSCKKMKDTQPGAIAKTLINLDQLHGD